MNMNQEHARLHMRARLSFSRSAIPEVVAYLEKIPQSELSAALSGLVQRAVLDLLRSQSMGVHTAFSARQAEMSASTLLPVSSAQTMAHQEPGSSAEPLAAFGLEDGGTDVFDYH